MKEPLCNSIASHFVECGVRELVTHHSLSSLSALLRRLQASSTVEPVQQTVVSSAYRNKVPEGTASGMSLVYKLNRHGPRTDPCGMPQVTFSLFDWAEFTTVICDL